MATFIHMADERKQKAIQKNGIKSISKHENKKGIYCFPVLKDYMISHQWSREIRRSGIRNYICIQFTIDDDEMVLIGKYNEKHVEVTASEAVKIAMDHDDPNGLEVFIQHRIHPDNIKRIYSAPRIIGWRFYPSAKGQKPFCRCKYCQRGLINAGKIIDRSLE